MKAPSSGPLLFESFFETGQEERNSPFLQEKARSWSIHLTLKASLAAGVFLIFSFLFSFHPRTAPLGYFLLLFVYFLAGIPSLIEAIYDLINFQVNIDILMTVAAFSSIFIGSGMEGGLLLVLFSLSGAMEDAVSAKAKSTIQSLHKLSPSTATLLQEDGTLIEKPLSLIKTKDILIIKASQIIPLDGKIIDGISSVNLVHLTGENLPITKKKGDIVEAGARNMEGTLTIEVTRTKEDSTLTKIIEMVTEAQEMKPKMQKVFDRFSDRYAITIILLSAFFALSLPFMASIPFLGREGSLYRALSFLIAASPCALIIAIPIAYLSALSALAKKGILLKGGIILDALTQCTSIAFDKTGTLTTGILSLEHLNPLSKDSLSENTALNIAYTLEKGALHPFAKSLLKEGEKKGLSFLPIDQFKLIPGYGVEGFFQIEGVQTKAFLGNLEFLSKKIDPSFLDKATEQKKFFEAQGLLVCFLLLDLSKKQDLFIFAFKDTLRKQIFETISSLKNKWHLKTSMLTGDGKENATRIAKETGIEEFYYSLKPEEKLQKIREKSASEKLVMVGDGVNDAPALATALVGICMGKIGSTAAMDASDIVLLQDNIELLDWLFQKASQTKKIVRQNLFVAISAIFIASIPALLGEIPLWVAVVMHEGGTVLVGLNALRLLKS